MSLYALIVCIDFFCFEFSCYYFSIFYCFPWKSTVYGKEFIYWKKIAFGCCWWYLLAFIYVLAGSYLCISMRWFWLFLPIFQGFPNSSKGWWSKSTTPSPPMGEGKGTRVGVILIVRNFFKVKNSFLWILNIN